MGFFYALRLSKLLYKNDNHIDFMNFIYHKIKQTAKDVEAKNNDGLATGAAGQPLSAGHIAGLPHGKAFFPLSITAGTTMHRLPFDAHACDRVVITQRSAAIGTALRGLRATGATICFGAHSCLWLLAVDAHDGHFDSHLGNLHLCAGRSGFALSLRHETQLHQNRLDNVHTRKHICGK